MPSAEKRAAMLTKLPKPIAQFFKATKDRNLDSLLSAFDEKAILKDMAHENKGRDGIKAWSDRQYLGLDVSAILLGTKSEESAFVATVRFDGDFQAFGATEPFALELRFELRGEKII